MPATQPPTKTAARSLLTRRNFLLTGAAASAGLALYSNDVSRHELEITHPTFFINNLPPAFDGFRIAQISDLHLEEFTEDYFLRHVVGHVNALAPDLVLVTGDFISRGPMPATAYAATPRCAAILAQLQCPLRYGILGNHDAAVGSAFVRNHMESQGLPLLVNQTVRIERGGQHFFLAGLDDVENGRPNLDLTLPRSPDAPVLLMVHEPDYAQIIADDVFGQRVDFIVSGHTHGGQIRLPGLGPIALPPLGKLYPHGHYQVGNAQLYVNRGIGTVGVPFRLNCMPEITLATLHPA